MLGAGITPVYVWDGKPPAFKRTTVEERIKVREAAREKWKEALEKGELEKVRMYAQAAIKLTKDMVEESKKLLAYMGVSSVQAPSEGEAQCTFMCREGQVWATASQDFDSLAFGCPRLVRNLNITGKRKLPRKEQYIVVKPELIELEHLLKELNLTQDQLIILGILVGTDYAPKGVKGIGPKKALKLVQEKKTLEKVMEGLEWEHPVTPQQLFEFFKKPHVDKLEIKKEELQPAKLKELMVEQHDFREDRIQKVIDQLTKKKEEGKQTGLGKFLG